jgi:hypothetical protein
MTSTFAAVENAGSNTLDRPSFLSRYPDIYSKVKNSLCGLPTGRISAEEFIEQGQESLDEVREDEDMVKFEKACRLN